MDLQVKHFLFKHYIQIVLGGFGASILWFFVLSAQGRDELALFLTLATGLGGFFYFVQKQQLEELRVFERLFKDINERYDRLNKKLNRMWAAEGQRPLSADENDTLNEYFNLCGEEYLIYAKGYIYPEVWRAWCNGMAYFLQNERIRVKWLAEEGTDSYYGLTLPEIRRQCTDPPKHPA